MKKRGANRTMQAWINAGERDHLSNAQVQMAREWGTKPAKLGQFNNHDEESWKMPFTDYIEHLYLERFGGHHPDAVGVSRRGSCRLHRR
jgi:hypothetical protein